MDATYLANLTTARENLAAALADMTANPKPNYSIDGQKVAWGDLFQSYSTALEKLNDQIAAAEPFESESVGFS